MSNKPTVNVRIKHKYDTYENWIKSSLILEAGELAIAKIKNGDNQLTPPTIGIKVGNGEQTFSELDWIQAIAGDVNSWAKESAPENLFSKTPDENHKYPQFISNLKTFISGNVNDTTYRFEWQNDILTIYQVAPNAAGGTTEAEIASIDLTHKANKLSVPSNYAGGHILTLSNDGDIEDSGINISTLATETELNDIAVDVSTLKSTINGTDGNPGLSQIVADNKQKIDELLGTDGEGGVNTGSITNLIRNEIVALQGREDLPDRFDTLVEIIDYIATTEDQEQLEDGVSLIKKVNKNTEDINTNAVAISTLQTTINGDSTNNTPGLIQKVNDNSEIIANLQESLGDETTGLSKEVNDLNTIINGDGQTNTGLVNKVNTLTNELNNTTLLANNSIQDIVVSNSVPTEETSYVTESTLTGGGITASINAIPVHLLTNSTIEGFTLVFDCGNANGFTSNNS